MLPAYAVGHATSQGQKLFRLSQGIRSQFNKKIQHLSDPKPKGNCNISPSILLQKFAETLVFTLHSTLINSVKQNLRLHIQALKN